jgi:cytochrome c553
MNRLFISLAAVMAILSTPVLAGDIKAGKAKSAMCASCHGADGNSPIPANPRLNGQHEKYLVKQLEDFTKAPAQGGRSSPVMGGMAAGLSADDRANLAAYYSSQESKMHAAPAVSDDDIAIGERIYRVGNEATGVPACMGCHGPQGNGNEPAGWPRLAGQHADYLSAQLKAFREAAQYPEDVARGRRNDGDGRLMRDAAARLSDRELEAVAAYLQGLH